MLFVERRESPDLENATSSSPSVYYHALVEAHQPILAFEQSEVGDRTDYLVIDTTEVASEVDSTE